MSTRAAASGPVRIFLCHSSRDKATIRDLYRRLQSDGFEPWLDEADLLPGQVWRSEIKKALAGADVVIVCLSRAMATERGYVHAEIKYVLDMAGEQPEGTLFIVPVRLEECEVPERLASFQWLDLFREDGYERLRLALEAVATKRVVPQSSEGASEPKKEVAPANATHPSGVRVMLSYSHRDSRFREQLDKHLALLKRQRLITVWHDRELTAGRDFDRGIAKELAAADIILLLISADFMASDYCYTKEMATALERHVAGTARVIPIILREVDWQHGPFAKLVALPLDGRPVTSWRRRDAAYLNIAIGLRRVVEELTGGEQPTRTQPPSGF